MRPQIDLNQNIYPYQRVLNSIANFSERRYDARLRLPKFQDPDIEVVRDAITKLPFLERAILSLIYWDKFSPGDAAHILGARRDVLLSRLTQAFWSLRSMLLSDPRFSRFQQASISVRFQPGL